MLTNRKIQRSHPRSKNFILKGGLNTEIAGIERSPGELAVCKNYVCAEGSYSGYQSLAGYERFDGQTAPSDVALETVGDEWTNTGGDYTLYERVTYNGYVFYCKQASGSGTNAPDDVTPGDNTWWGYEAASGSEDQYQDRAREAQRALITAVPGYGQIRGLHVHNSKVYAWQNDLETATTTDLYVSSGSGWTQVLAASTEMDPDGDIKAITARFRYHPVGSAGEETMYWIDGVTEGFFYLDPGTGTYKNVTHANMPSGYAPKHIGFWENRLFLVYEDGYTIFSNTGYPEDFASDTGTAGNLDFNEPVTNIVTVAGKLVVFTKRTITIVHYGSTTSQFVIKTDVFSESIGAFEDTVQSLFEQTYFCDDRGISGIFTAVETGGFAIKPISKKIDDEYQSRKLFITATVKDIAKRRYYIFYSNADGTQTSEGLCLTFDDENRLKGTGKIELKHKALIAASGLNNSTGDSLMFFGDSSGYVYQMESGTSMDGDTIDTYMLTAFYHYGSPSLWKHFERVALEITCSQNTSYSIGAVYDYGSKDFPAPFPQSKDISGGFNVWGGGITWSNFEWGAGYMGTLVAYLSGWGSNMGLAIKTSTHLKTIHTIHNVTTNYSLGGSKL